MNFFKFVYLLCINKNRPRLNWRELNKHNDKVINILKNVYSSDTIADGKAYLSQCRDELYQLRDQYGPDYYENIKIYDYNQTSILEQSISNGKINDRLEETNDLFRKYNIEFIIFHGKIIKYFNFNKNIIYKQLMETPVVNKINLNDKFCNNNFCYLKQRDNPNIIKKKNLNYVESDPENLKLNFILKFKMNIINYEVLTNYMF